MTTLIGDIGGTNARFALARQEDSIFTNEQTLQCSDFSNVIEAIKHYLNTTKSESPNIICLAVAGPVINQAIQFSNNPWTFTATELREEFSSTTTHLLNDFEAIAYSIPFLQSDDLLNIGQPFTSHDKNSYTAGVVGPGTGLGAVGLQKNDTEVSALMTEAGHTGFSPTSPLQIELLQVLEKIYQRVSNERLISGPGIINLYNAICLIYDSQCEPLSTAEIYSEHISSKNTIATKTINLFYELLGQFAGDFALSIGAFDGIYIAGGVAQRYPEILADSNFRKGFENKGRHQNIMMDIPTNLILHEQPGLLGAYSFAKNKLN